jgi:hypothetical protein
MSRRGRRRHVRVPPDLTSLFDVLFIVIFVALIRAAAAQHDAAAAAAPKPPPPPLPPAQPLPAEQLHDRALVQLVNDVGNRPVVIARISTDGKLSAIEHNNRKITLDLPLLEQNRDPDIALAYLGDRSAELRVCRQTALQLGLADLAGYLVIFAPDARSADLPHALFEGLRRDVDRCQIDQHGLAVVVEPEAPEAPEAPEGETR